jgi:hypothetical protein
MHHRLALAMPSHMWQDMATKLLFPTCDGSEDPLPWLNRCD